MSWPHPPDYNEAIQNPKFCFSDPELQRGQPAVNALGLPWPRSGNHADVYKLVCPGGQCWAVKCFTREVRNLRRRYQAISDHLRQTVLPAMVDFQYQDEGIRVHGQWYPIVKMRWVDGLTLNELLREHADKPGMLERLAQLWLRLAQEMRHARIAHGDLQHGNVLLVPGATAGTLRLRLVDYDGLVVPALAQVPSGEVGHPNYQHPQRLRDGTYDAEVDRFAHLLIYTTIRCVALGGRSLWEKYDNGENFLFREQDFQAPAQSLLFQELSELNDPEAQALVGHLLTASMGPLDRVPLLDEVIDTGTVRPLGEEQQQEVARCLAKCYAIANDAPAEAMRSDPRVTLSRLSGGTATLVLGPGKKSWRGPYAPPKGRFAFAEPLYRKGRRTAKRLKGWSTAAVLTACAGLGLATFALLVGMILWVGTLLVGSTTEAATEGAKVEPPPPLIAPTPGVYLRPGENRALPVRLQRQGWAGPIELRVEGLPKDMGYTPTTIPTGGDSAILLFHAVPGARETVRQVEITALARDRVLARTNVPLTLLLAEKWPFRDRQPPLPQVRLSLAPPGPARLIPPTNAAMRLGKNLTIPVRLLREGRDGPLQVEVAGLPKGIACRVLPVANDPDAVELDVRASARAVQGTSRVELRATLGGQPIEGRVFLLTILSQRPPRPLRPVDLALQAGQSRFLRIEVEREDHQGPIDIELHGLPEGVACAPATILADQNAVSLKLTAAADVPGDEREIEVWALVGAAKAGKESFLLTIRPSPPAPEPELPNEKVGFSTVDGVHLVGTWYPGAGGAESACVLLLHQPGGHRNRADWNRLARLLQKKGHAVLTFDFRGHGDSTRVERAFWNHTANRALTIGDLLDAPASISYKNFTPTYYPMLVNDIAASRTFLDQKNDRHECNASKLVVIGAEEGAALAAMWLYGEWHRFQMTSPDPLLLSGVPEGRQTAAAVWLSIRPQLGGRFCRAAQWLKFVGSDHRVPMGFIYAADDETGAPFARQCLREMKPARFLQHLTSDKAIRGSSVAGHELLEKIPAVNIFILNYIDTVLKTVPHPRWSQRSTSVRSFYWRFPNGVPLPAKAKGEALLHLAPLERLQGP